MFFFVAVSVPIVIVFVFISFEGVEWGGLIKVANNRLGGVFPGYTVRADSVFTHGFGFWDVGTIYITVDNLVLEDEKTGSVKVSIENAQLSFSIKDVVLGRFIPMIHRASGLMVVINVDTFSGQQEVDTQRLVSYFARYMSGVVDRSLSRRFAPEANIENLMVVLNRSDSPTASLVLKRKKTHITRVGSGVFGKKTVLYDFDILVNNKPAALKVSCEKKGGSTRCGVASKGVQIEPFVNEFNRSINLGVEGFVVDFGFDFYIKKNYITMVRGWLDVPQRFDLYNLSNKHKRDFGGLSLVFLITKNLKSIIMEDIDVVMPDDSLFHLGTVAADFLNTKHLSIMDVGNMSFKTSGFSLTDLYYYTFLLFGVEYGDALRGSVNKMFVLEEAYVVMGGNLFWSFAKDHSGSVKNNIDDYNISVAGSTSEAKIPHMNNMVAKDVDVDIFFKPGKTKTKIRNAIVCGSKIENTTINFINKKNTTATFDEHGWDVSSLSCLSFGLFGVDVLGVLTPLNINKDVGLDIKGLVEIPTNSSQKKTYTDSRVNIDVDSTRVVSDYFDTDVVSAKITKESGLGVLLFRIKPDTLNLFVDKDKKEVHQGCLLDVPVSILFDEAGAGMVSSIQDASMFCGKKTMAKLGFKKNKEKKISHFYLRVFGLLDNDFGVFLENGYAGYNLDISGYKINATPFFDFVVKDVEGGFFGNAFVGGDDSISLKIKTPRMRKLRNVADVFLKSGGVLDKHINTQIRLDIDSISMLGGYSIKKLKGYLSKTTGVGSLANVNAVIVGPHSKKPEYLDLKITKSASGEHKDVYVKIGAIQRLIKSLTTYSKSPITKGSLVMRGKVDDGNVTGSVCVENLLYSRKSALFFKNIRLKEVSSNLLYNYKENIIMFDAGLIDGPGIVGDFTGTVNLNDEYIGFLAHVAFGSSQDAPVFGPALIPKGADKNLTGLQWDLSGYLNGEINGSISLSGDKNYVKGYLALLAVAVGSVFR